MSFSDEEFDGDKKATQLTAPNPAILCGCLIDLKFVACPPFTKLPPSPYRSFSSL